MIIRWIELGRIAFRFDYYPGRHFDLGIHLSIDEPGFDFFFGNIMLGVTTTKHAKWIQESVQALEEN